MQVEPTRIVILGAGFGGLYTPPSIEPRLHDMKSRARTRALADVAVRSVAWLYGLPCPDKRARVKLTAGDCAWLMLFITLIDLVERIESLAGLSSSALSFPFVSTGLMFRCA